MAFHNHNIIALHIDVEGLVQGVGFRPFVYRLAMQYGFKGWVVNRTEGLQIRVEGRAELMPEFLSDLKLKAPVIAQVEEIVIEQKSPEGLQDFYIKTSQDLSDDTSEISPDIAVCLDCLEDLKTQQHRIHYPFVNCTNCGPRFSIIQSFPYDRSNTTMKKFEMCGECRAEYENILDRRFHAQPVACNLCGPSYTLHLGGEEITDLNLILTSLCQLIEQGKIIAVKGVGGFHLLCDALNETTVRNLRKSKMREGKPFAVMFRDLDTVKNFAHVSEEEESSLISWQRPVVILKCLKSLAAGVSLGLDTIGAFLPYMPLHYLLFERLSGPALVLTSGNLSDEPIVIDNAIALNTFRGITDAVLTYNRDIYNRTDDSVVRIIAGREVIMRRSRGFVPSPLKLSFKTEGILATGAELVNCFCIGKGNRAYLSQHIGDLKNYETFAFYEETIDRFRNLFRIAPNLVACDMHPDYFSTRYAQKLGLKTFQVQHHHAHIASCMAEYGINEPVIGLAFDGTGFGDDGNTWGSEFLVCDYLGYRRYGHFDYMMLPGGDKVTEQPWRMALSLLYQAYGKNYMHLGLPLFKKIDEGTMRLVNESMMKKINCPLSSGAGRLFDAVAAITGLCVRSLFHAEAPMRLESSIVEGVDAFYEFDLSQNISFLPAIRGICYDMESKVRPGMISAKFHNTIAEASYQMVKKINMDTGIKKIVLSGGSFQNKYLSEKLEKLLVMDNFTVFIHRKVPCNDGGIALGQLAVAAQQIGNSF